MASTVVNLVVVVGEGFETFAKDTCSQLTKKDKQRLK